MILILVTPVPVLISSTASNILRVSNFTIKVSVLILKKIDVLRRCATKRRNAQVTEISTRVFFKFELLIYISP